ncbi:MAG: hypothetical protein WC777_05500 [Candidatus Gracilibacteria bacterium]|jgi:4-amino-4-deoxy-L-arabinose transferase-like glycosyltransferase
MMYGSSSSLGLGLMLHGLFMFLALLGLVAGIVWMARFATKKQLKVWFWVGIILGLIGSWATCAAATNNMREMMGDWGNWGEFGDDEGGSELNDRVESMEEWRDEMMDLEDDEAVETPVE